MRCVGLCASWRMDEVRLLDVGSKYLNLCNSNVIMQTELKQIPNYSSYLASKDGRVFSTISRKFLSPGKDKNGYLQCMVKCDDGKTHMRKIHRLIALAHLPPVEGKNVIDHINGIVSDNRVENLRWCTTKENRGFPLARKRNSESQKRLCQNGHALERLREIGKRGRETQSRKRAAATLTACVTY